MAITVAMATATGITAAVMDITEDMVAAMATATMEAATALATTEVATAIMEVAMEATADMAVGDSLICIVVNL